MASLFRDRSLGLSKRDTMTSTASSRFTSPTTAVTSSLPSPFGDLTPTLSPTDLRETAYEIFIVACRTSSGKPLTFVTSNSMNGDRSPSPSPSSLSSSPLMQRSLTSTAASKMKKAMGLRSSSNSVSGLKKSEGSPGSGGKSKKPLTVEKFLFALRGNLTWCSNPYTTGHLFKKENEWQTKESGFPTCPDMSCNVLIRAPCQICSWRKQ